MVQNRMSGEKNRVNCRVGTRCHICTGCGQCVSVRQDIHVLTNAATEKKGVVGRRSAAELATDTAFDKGRRAKNSAKHLIIADIGTTTIAMQLLGGDGCVVDTFAAVNPQTRYGADVVSRIQTAENPADAERMKQMVREVLCQGIKRFRSRIEVAEQPNGIEMFQMIVAANTTMVYLLMGYDTAELGKAPFHASHLQPIETVIEGTPCYIVPGLSAFVGGDIMAGILACGMHESEDLTLLIDLGTNGEMVLGNQYKMIACATAAGPAFEGGVNRGVWGADMVSLLARLRRDRIVDETGLLAEPYFEQGIRIGNVHVTQESIRAIQLAKGAIVAGIRILAREYGVELEQIGNVVLAGGFGYYLNPQDAAEIGLLPRELVENASAGGNTALTGAGYIGARLLEEAGKDRFRCFEKIIEKTNILNLAEIKTFQDIYFSSMELV